MIVPLLLITEGGLPELYSSSSSQYESDELELRRVAVELLEMALDLGGLVDPTPFCDGMSALMAVSQGRWLDAALSGVGILPYVGDLAKAGKLPRYLRTMDAVSALMARSQRAREALRPALARLDVALSWLPARGSVYVASLKQRVRGLLPISGRSATRTPLPDVSGQFQFPDPVMNGKFIERIAQGRLGVPGRIKVHHQASKTHRPLNEKFRGDDAGHLLGARFGAPDIAENLAPQNYRINRGVFNHTIEDHWASLLERGIGVEATVIVRYPNFKVRYREDINRPISWYAEWVEISRDGRRIPRNSKGSDHVLYIMNPDTAKSRAGRNIPKRDNERADVIDIFTRRRLNETKTE
jgi:hypothetical protein